MSKPTIDAATQGFLDSLVETNPATLDDVVKGINGINSRLSVLVAGIVFIAFFLYAIYGVLVR